jgi:alpha-glucosidase
MAAVDVNRLKSSRQVDWWIGAVIYQIYPRSFQDSNGDGIGDLNGITARLPYVKSLGVDAIWISPFFKSPMADFGYDVSDYRQVDPMFGSIDDFRRLIAKAHELGIKVIIDMVISHTSDQHEWFKESRSSNDNPKADWYVWADAAPDGTAPNNWLAIFGGPAWEWDTTRCQYYMHNFLAAQPDLNFHNEHVQQAALSETKFWLDLGIDGVRLDTANYYFCDKQLRSNPPRKPTKQATFSDVNPYGRQHHDHDKTQPENVVFMQRLRKLLDEYGAISIGEVGDEDRSLQTMAQYSSGGDKLHMCYTFDMLGGQFDPKLFKDKVGGFIDACPDGWPCWAFSNHDVERHLTRWAELGMDRAHLARFAINLLVSLRGQVCLYNGEELGLTEARLQFEDLQDPYGIRFWPKFKGRDGCRTPMVWDENSQAAGFSSGRPWLPVPDDHLERAAANQETYATSTLNDYRNALKMRKKHPALARGKIRFIEVSEHLLVFERSNGGERILCAFNFGKESSDISALNGLHTHKPISASGLKGLKLSGHGWCILAL